MSTSRFSYVGAVLAGTIVIWTGTGLASPFSLARAGTGTDTLVGRWIDRTPPAGQSIGPKGAEDCATIYDPIRDRLIVYGGKDDADQNGSETWAFDPAERVWAHLKTSGPKPPASEDHTAVYDPLGDRLILYGGENGLTTNKLWSLDLKTLLWRDLTNPEVPRRESHTAVYDGRGKRMVVFGGFDRTAVDLHDIWSMDLDPGSPTFEKWQNLTVAEGRPPGRIDHSAVYDVNKNRMVFHGGWTKARKAFFGDTWAFYEVKLRPDFSLMLGARYDFESYIHDSNNVAPRVAFAFAPGRKKTSVRGGVGVFYERLGESGVEQVLLFDGSRTRTLVITDPSYPNPFAAGTASLATPSRYQFGPDLSTGSLVQSGVSLERELRRKTSVAIEYANLRGVDLFRVRDLNAPLPGTSLRPDPALRQIAQIESTGSMKSNALNVTFHAGAGSFEGSAVYTYARTYNDTPGAKAGGSLALTLPANNYDPGAEWGRADFDVRHRFNLAGVLELPRGFQIGSILEVRSGKPCEITTGFDDNFDTNATDRPAGLRRNAGQTPGFGRLDLRLTKLFQTARPLRYPAARPGHLELSVDAFNVLNRVNYREIVGVQSSPFFGRAISAEQARKIQVAISYRF